MGTENGVEETGKLIIELLKHGVTGVDVLGMMTLLVVGVILVKGKDMRAQNLAAALGTLPEDARKEIILRMEASRTHAGWMCLISGIIMVPITLGLICISQRAG